MRWFILLLMTALLIMCFDLVVGGIFELFNTMLTAIDKLITNITYSILHKKYKQYFIYRVGRGESYFDVARRCDIQLTLLLMYNKVTNVNIIFVGQRIMIPKMG
jgi:hypothetical protein